MFRKFIDLAIRIVNGAHTKILSLNDHSGLFLSDKQLHFIVIGIVGMALLLIVFPIFKYLARQNKVMAISWIYVFTIMTVISCLIEIGQKITGSGDMDFADILAGLVGFILISFVYIIIRKLFFKEKDKIVK